MPNHEMDFISLPEGLRLGSDIYGTIDNDCLDRTDLCISTRWQQPGIVSNGVIKSANCFELIEYG